MPSPPATVIERRDDVVIVSLRVSDLDEQNMQSVQIDIEAAAAQAPALPFVLDMRSIKFIPSISLGALTRMTNAFRARNQRLVLAGLQPAVRQMMHIARLDRVFEIRDDVEAALTALRG